MMSGGLGRLTAGLNGFVGQLHDLVIEVSSRSADIANAASQISAGSGPVGTHRGTSLHAGRSGLEHGGVHHRSNKLLRVPSAPPNIRTRLSMPAERGAAVAVNAVTKIGAANDSDAPHWLHRFHHRFDCVSNQYPGTQCVGVEPLAPESNAKVLPSSRPRCVRWRNAAQHPRAKSRDSRCDRAG